MKRRDFMTMLAGAVLAMSGLVASTAGAGPDERPNIIVVMADDMGFSDLGCYGGEIKTPTIDRLASEGVRFSQFYNFAICGPSRASLMTGCYPWDVGVHTWSDMLNQRGATIPQLLRANGYETCVVGRFDNVTTANWHKPQQIARHIDRFLGSASGGPSNYYEEAKKNPWFKDGERWQRPEGAYSTDLISDFVAAFIESTVKSDKPFFIYVSHYAPHWPLQADEEHVAPYRDIYEKTQRTKLMQARLDRLIKDGLVPKGTTLPESALNAKSPNDGTPFTERAAIHAAMVERIDRSVAEMMAALQKADKLENTLILVLSDNGASAQMVFNRPVPKGVRAGSRQTFINQGPAVAALNNTPFRGYKMSYYEGGIASPLVAWWPKGLKGKGRISHRPSLIADIMPTCLELAGASYPATFEDRTLIPLAGTSFVNVLRGSEEPQDAQRVLAWPEAVREGDWKLVIPPRVQPQLYNIRTDRNERHDLAEPHSERVRQMLALHARLYTGPNKPK